MEPVAREIAPFPWHSLEAVARRTARLSRKLRAQLPESLTVSTIASTLAEVLHRPVAVTALTVKAREAMDDSGLVVTEMELSDGLARARVLVERELAAHALASLLGETLPPANPLAAFDARLNGAVSAVIAACARRATAGGRTWRVVPSSTPRPGLFVELCVQLLGKPYAAFVQVSAERELPPVRGPSDWARVASLPIELSLVAGSSLVTRSELHQLENGSAWLAGEGWWIDRAGAGRAALASPSSENGVLVALAEDGTTVLRGDPVALPAEPEPASDAALEAPLVVRLELASIVMSARQWAALRPGDVVQTGRRLGESVVLRVAGREIARGELIRINDELAVRIRRVVH
jgi:hypothetical protein